MKRNEMSLTELSRAVKKSDEISLTKRESISAKELIIIKRNGSEEHFNVSKLKKVVEWACDYPKAATAKYDTKTLLDGVRIKLYNKIKIVALYDELIKTAVNNISLIHPHWEYISAKLFLLKIYKEGFNVKNKKIPSFTSIVQQGISHKIYSKSIFSQYSEEELDEISSFIIQERDFLFTYKALVFFYDKYCINYSKYKTFELPQYSYMRVACALMVSEPKHSRLQSIKNLYDEISTHKITFATPIMINAGSPHSQLSSCVLNRLSDDTHSILDTNKNIAIYSKYRGGTALDICSLRSKGSHILGNNGLSSGAVPFIQLFEASMKAWNQGCVSKNSFVQRMTRFKTKYYSYEAKEYKRPFTEFQKDTTFTDERVLVTDVKIGDFIKSFNIDSKEIEYKEVVDIIYPTVKKCDQVQVNYSGGSLITSVSHPICIEENNEYKYIDTGDLLEGDFVRSCDSNLCVTNVNKDYEESEDFIDFTVQGNNNFFVSSKKNENFIVSHNSTRPGSCCIYFQWWNYDVKDLIVLKSNGGTGENRARGLKYAVKINQIFIDRAIANQDITLFDPKDAAGLLDIEGDTFNECYEQLEKRVGIRKKRISARELWFIIIKERLETGNIYLFHDENVNQANMLGQKVHSSNLCTEILECTEPSTTISEELIIREDQSHELVKKYTPGKIALCNLASINLIEYSKLSESGQKDLIAVLMKAMDNTIDLATYPVKEAKHSNLLYRYLGIGVTNFANLLATNQINFNSTEALDFTFDLFEDLTYKIIDASCDLAKERGSFPYYHKTLWSENKLPIDFANKSALALTKSKLDTDKWNVLRNKIQKYGMRNALTTAIAPTACLDLNTTIKTEFGILTLKDICKLKNVPYEYIQNKGEPCWINFSTPIQIQTHYGLKRSNRIWYNGKKETVKITFEDQYSFIGTHNHKLLKVCGDDSQWIQLEDLKDTDDYVMRYSDKEGASMLPITKKEYNTTPVHTWDLEVDEVHEYLLGNGVISHNTTAKAINATESIEPIQHFYYKEEGTLNATTIVPNFKQNSKYYTRGFECSPVQLINLAAIRQIFIDQSQSVNMYIPEEMAQSFKKLLELHFYSFSMGLKTLYYLKSEKTDQDEICESCS